MKGVHIVSTVIAYFAAVSFAATDKVVCYYGSWATYRHGNGKFDVEDINTDLCTHAIFTFLGLNTDGTIKVLDPWNEIDLRAFERFGNLKLRKPSIKLLIAIGGWNEGSSTFSKVVNNPTLRKTFIGSIVNFVTKYGYDGFDIDWEYPGQRGGIAADRSAFVTLLKELRVHFDQNGWLLTAAVAGTKSNIDISYDVPKVSKYLDIINVMAYDLHGAWDGKTGQNAPLYSSKIDTTDNAKQLNVDSVITGWITAGAKPEQITIGMGTYGRTFTLSNSANNGLGAPAVNGGNAGPYTGTIGILGYNEICEKLKAGGWTRVWDDEQKTPYLYNGNQWVGYDDVESIKIKSQYAVDKNLGGVMIWSIETDDHKNICGDGRFSLLTAINNVINNNGSVQETTTTKTTTTTKYTTITKSTTTTIKPTGTTTEGSSSGELCHEVGYVRDPFDCGVFYYCQESGEGFNAIQFKCPNGLVYDIDMGICNYPSEVIC